MMMMQMVSGAGAAGDGAVCGRAHLVQGDLLWEDREGNYALTDEMLAGVDVRAGDLVVLCEMFDTGFSFRTERTADGDGRTLGYLQGLARRLGVTVHGARTVVDGSDGRGRNLATVVGPNGDVICEYVKVHPFSFGRESEFFTGGDRVVTYRARIGSDEAVVCPAVCYDLRFPELFREGLRLGAEMIVLGANWPAARAGHWRALAIARAIENQALVLAVNRCGSDPHLSYNGGTIAVGSKGEVLGELGGEAGVLSVPVDLAAVREWRGTFPAWKDGKLAPFVVE